MALRVLISILVAGSLLVSDVALAQVDRGCAKPFSERTAEFGCYFAATEELGTLPETTLFWHLYVYPDRVEAEAAKGSRSTVVESMGKVWLYTIAESDWRPAGGERIAVIGPLPHDAHRQYTARYMEAVFTPGMSTLVHTHSGPEAWYVLDGAQCLETADGITVVRAGEGSVVQEGPPMVLSTVGKQVRRAVFVVLHDSTKPWQVIGSDWTPKGLCPKE